MPKKEQEIQPIDDDFDNVVMSTIKKLKSREKEMLKATHKGNFNGEFGSDVECYVLNDKTKTAVISQGGMGNALGLGEGGTRLTRFVNNKTMTEYIWPELRSKIENPIIFQSFRVDESGQTSPSRSAYGYDVTILIDICKAIIKAESDGKLKGESSAVKQAHIIINASAKAGIKGLVYALAGYDATRQEIIESFKLYVREEAREYEAEFPEQLYNEWYRIYQLPKPDRNRPWKFMHLTNSHVYKPLANTSGNLLKLIVDNRKQSKEVRQKRLHQFLSEIGVKALRQHLGQLLGIARLSKTREQYEKNFEELFGNQPELPFEED
jgi:hypothetical protein